MHITSRKGFTLIEILIVVAIIGILATTIFVGLNPSRAKGRDTRRVSDLKSVQNGLELYYARYGRYPDTLNQLIDPNLKIDKLPTDPSTATEYFYSQQSNQGYILAAKLEAATGDAIYLDSNKVSISGYTGNVPNCTEPHFCVTF